MHSNDETIKQLKMKRILVWFALFFSLACAAIMLYEREWAVGLVSLMVTVIAIYALIKLQRNLSAELKPYRPGKGFWYYRMSRDNKLNYLTAGQVVAGLILIADLAFLSFSYIRLFFCLFGIVFIQTVIKKRIALHTEVDDATLFELEELGLISPYDSVQALYKDFATWESVRPGHKIVVITRDKFIALQMEGTDNAARLDCPLREIDRIGIIENGVQGEGMLITIGTAGGGVLRIKLTGSSNQDSPEQFVSHFLACLDRVLTTSTSEVTERQPRHPGPPVDLAAPVQLVPDIRIRMVDLHDSRHAGENGPSNAHRSSTTGGRHIDL